MATLAEIRAKLKDQENKPGGSPRTGGDNVIYPFRNLKEGEQATVRFHQMEIRTTLFFRKERLMIKLSRAGIKGDTDPKTHKYKFMYGNVWRNLSQYYPKSEVGPKIQVRGHGKKILEEKKLHPPKVL